MSMSVGIVSAIGRNLPKLASQEHRIYSNLIQTTAEINPGNSGGPLFGIDGKVIGISTAVILAQKSSNGIGFALPITPETLQKIQSLREGRETNYAYLGVMVSTPSVRQRRGNRLPSDSGVIIDSIEETSPAADGLKPGDAVLAVNDVPVADEDHFIRVVGGLPVDKSTKLLVHREGQTMTLMVRPRKRELPSVAVNRDNQRMRWRGMLLGPIPLHWDFTPAERPDSGLMVFGVDPQSPVNALGVHSGAVISSVAGKPIKSVTELQNILSSTPAEQCDLVVAPLPREVFVSGRD
jgi:serine protease Do